MTEQKDKDRLLRRIRESIVSKSLLRQYRRAIIFDEHFDTSDISASRFQCGICLGHIGIETCRKIFSLTKASHGNDTHREEDEEFKYAHNEGMKN